MYKTKAKPNSELYKQSTKPALIEPNRKWFGNTRLMNQNEMDKYKDILSEMKDDPQRVIVKSKKLPLQMLSNQDSQKNRQMNVLSIQPFEHTFGKKSIRKKPKLLSQDLNKMVENAEERSKSYSKVEDKMNVNQIEKDKPSIDEKQITAGQSRRIWDELYKVIDSSDVIMQVLDSRDPEGTRSPTVEHQVKKNCPNKHIVCVLNKTDLVPSRVVSKWVEYLSQFQPTIAFQASINRSFGKTALLNLLKQYSNVFTHKKSISVGLVGFPNVGKSSVINTLRKKKVCQVAAVPGETKIWQQVTLTNKIYVIDCPGVVHENTMKSEAELVLSGVVRIEKLSDPVFQIDSVLKRIEPKVFADTQDIPYQKEWDSGVISERQSQWEKWSQKQLEGKEQDFNVGEAVCDAVGRKQGRLLKHDVADLKSAAKIILSDQHRGNMSWFVECTHEIGHQKDTKEDYEMK